ncbi:MAG: transcription antitermination factor NusB [Syntrophomonadaceae bacterium]|nr:transcription antitermination factor NusB [Syntrophomonadaceae bacterium]
MSRRKARDAAFKILFTVDLVNADAKEALLELDQDYSIREENRKFIAQLVQGTLVHLQEIDQRISHFSPYWPLERMAAVDRTLLRMATYEMLFAGGDVHPVVVINEAVELAKTYGDAHSHAFINAILDRIKEVGT